MRLGKLIAANFIFTRKHLSFGRGINRNYFCVRQIFSHHIRIAQAAAGANKHFLYPPFYILTKDTAELLN
jgi:hypothetical protein